VSGGFASWKRVRAWAWCRFYKGPRANRRSVLLAVRRLRLSAQSVCALHTDRAGACALRVVSLRSLSPTGCSCLFVFLFYGRFCSAFGFCCALTGSLSFGVRARCPLKTTPTGLPHSLALPSRCRCGEGSIRGEGTVSCSRGNCRGTGSDTNQTGSRSKLRC
jgi:hypothetical protein